ncbi:Hsp20/alpha crystallin family protein [Paenibacillus piri]|uniref:Hsp20/alpha crystallin family protein n=1 Tax=Paenibacillus piri TaxID=2547395 RepID=A0A4V6PII9_9BACL|nr:Hsp20/alpha crystallin family protein [Paenibacillus piri]TDF98144.1 hypothetical protein E1757_11630 [Paenibacillus piri]
MSRRDTDNKSRWHEIEKFLGNKLPPVPSSEQLDLLKDTTWVEDYVQQIFEKSLPKTGVVRSLRTKPEIFETHHHVIVKLALAQQANPIIKVRTDLIKIESIVNSQKPQLIRLPCHVIPSTARASYRDGILQIKVRKKRLNKTYHEVNVRYL